MQETIGALEPDMTTDDGRIPVLSVIIPTFNERDNVVPLRTALNEVLGDTDFEIVFVDDDSSDGTRTELLRMARLDRNIRVIRRIGRRGLASAVIEGILSTTTPYFAVIDADGQHDEKLLPQMLAILQSGSMDIVVGSRYLSEDSIKDWDGKRAHMSAIANWLARHLTRSTLSDPMSGFFAMRREAFDEEVAKLSGQGYKILLDICASANHPLRIHEVPYRFRPRRAGESKLDALVVWEYLVLLADKLVGRFVPVRFLAFAIIGMVGVVVHVLTLAIMMFLSGSTFWVSQAVATLCAMTFNFFVNNMLTYRDRRLKGAFALAKGLVTFMAACSVGIMANVGIANYLFSDRSYVWWLAGLAGIFVGVVWNYAASSIFTWGRGGGR
jgi:dolichol-phosphate mannosyltransferase